MFSTISASSPAGSWCPSSSASSRAKAAPLGSPKRTLPPGRNQYPSPSTVHSKIFPPRVITAATRRLKVSLGPLQEMSLPAVTACPPALAIGQSPAAWPSLTWPRAWARPSPSPPQSGHCRPAKVLVPIHTHMTLDKCTQACLRCQMSAHALLSQTEVSEVFGWPMEAVPAPAAGGLAGPVQGGGARLNPAAADPSAPDR